MNTHLKSVTPANAWQCLLTYLFNQHYGLALNDTPFHDVKVIEQHIDAGITPLDAINSLVQRYDLVRIDRRGFSGHEQDPLLTALDMLRARRATGVLLQTKVVRI